MNSGITALFLQEVSRKYPDEKIVFILDNVKYHNTQGNSDYPLPKNIELLFLPAYSPDLNLQERICNHFKTEYVNNKFFPNLEELSFTINKGLRELLYQPEILKSICSTA